VISSTLWKNLTFPVQSLDLYELNQVKTTLYVRSLSTELIPTKKDICMPTPTLKFTLKPLAALITLMSAGMASSQTVTCESPYLVTSAIPQENHLTLVEALNLGVTNCSDFVVQVDDSLSGQTLPAESESFSIAGRSVEVTGPTSGSVAIAADSTISALFVISDTGSLSLSNFVIDGTELLRDTIATSDHVSSLTLEQVTVSNIDSSGVIKAYGSTSISDSHFENNGRVLYQSIGGTSTLEITNSHFIGNESVASIYQGSNLENPVNIVDSIFEDTQYGTLTFQTESNEAGTVNIQNSKFLGNKTYEYGGAVHFSNFGEINISDSVFNGNQSELEEGGGRGGAIYARNGSVHIERSIFIDSYTDFGGGAIHLIDTAHVEIQNSSFINNVSSQGTGAIEIQNAPPSVSITHSSFFGNQSFSTEESAVLDIYSADGSTIDINHVVMANNTSGTYGPICVHTAPESSSTLNINYSFIDAHYSDTQNCNILVQDLSENIFGARDTPVNPVVSELRDNDNNLIGYIPESTSPLVNAGDSNITGEPPFDQIGLERIVRGIIDIGSIEYRNSPPTGTTIPNITSAGISFLRFDISHYFSEPDLDQIYFSASGLPDGLAMENNSSFISGNVENTGVNTVTITATDIFGGTTSADFIITVTNVEPAYTIPHSIEFEYGEDIAINLTPLIIDADGTIPVIEILNLPSGFTFNENTITVPHSAIGENRTYSIEIGVSDDFSTQTIVSEFVILATPTVEPTLEPTQTPTDKSTPEPTTQPIANQEVRSNNGGSKGGGGGALDTVSIVSMLGIALFGLFGRRKPKA